MLDERSEDETAHEHDAHGKFQPLSIVLARNDQQEGIDGQQHGSEHQQDVGNQDACGHVVAETYHDWLILQIVLAIDGEIVL